MALTELTEAQQRARATWSAGNFDAIVHHIWSVGGDLVERVGVNAGDKVLDVACGTGNASIPAAQAGGKVTGLDITPELLEAGRRRAGDAGVDIDWVEGDAQDLPFEEGTFDVLLSTFGCMFAPDHQRAAAEIVRVLKPGGRFGIAAWDPEGNIGGKFFAAMAPFAPQPPPGFQPPQLWGARDHVSGLFDGTGVELRFEDAAVDFRFDSIDAATEEYWENFGPIVVLRRTLEPNRVGEFHTTLRQLFEDSNESEGGGVVYPGEYLINLGTKNE
jgi:SAM-dependent methyltransferase